MVLKLIACRPLDERIRLQVTSYQLPVRLCRGKSGVCSSSFRKLNGDPEIILERTKILWTSSSLVLPSTCIEQFLQLVISVRLSESLFQWSHDLGILYLASLLSLVRVLFFLLHLLSMYIRYLRRVGVIRHGLSNYSKFYSHVLMQVQKPMALWSHDM